MIRHDVGLLPVIMSNGLRIAEDRGFACSLKDAGLSRVHLQFDTLRNDTYRRLRGREDVTEKTRAIQNILAVGLRFGLITTVCSQNLEETGELLDYALTLSARS